MKAHKMMRLEVTTIPPELSLEENPTLSYPLRRGDPLAARA